MGPMECIVKDHFHVVVKLRGEAGWCLVFEDLSRRELLKLFVKPYRKGDDILTRGRIFRPAEIEEVRIGKTPDTAKEARKKYQEESSRRLERLNRDGSVAIISPGYGYRDYEIMDCSEDVTGRFLSSGPGTGRQSVVRAIIYDPWVVRIGGGLILAGLLALVAYLR